MQCSIEQKSKWGGTLTKRTKKIWLIVFAIVISLILFFYYQNNSIITTEISFTSKNIPQDFDGYKIVQLSDVHNTTFGNNQSVLVEKVKKAKPDVIVVTGDLIDSYTYDEEPSLILMEQLVKITPVYYVTGNHEWRTGTFHSLEGKLQNLGVRVLRNETNEISIGSATIQMIGIDDPSKLFDTEHYLTEEEIAEESIIDSMKGLEEGSFNILLSHRPELFHLYAQQDLDLVFTGHAHGGQIRIPFIGGIIAPNQGFFPKYTSGAHTLNDTTMIVNRGLGNSLFPLRVFNRPEIVVVTLESTQN